MHLNVQLQGSDTAALTKLPPPVTFQGRGVHRAVHLYSQPLPRPGLSPRSPKHRHHLIIGEMTCEQTALQPALPGHGAQGEGNNTQQSYPNTRHVQLLTCLAVKTHTVLLQGASSRCVILLQPPQTPLVSAICVEPERRLIFTSKK